MSNLISDRAPNIASEESTAQDSVVTLQKTARAFSLMTKDIDEHVVLDLSTDELESCLKVLDEEITMFERVRELGDSTELSPPSHFERRQLNWNVGWESFQAQLTVDCELQSEMFKKESDVQTSLALAAMYARCGDLNLSEEYTARAENAAFDYGCIMASIDSDSDEETPPVLFKEETIQARFVEGLNS